MKRKIIYIDEKLCNGCGNCVLSCAEGAIQIIDGKAKIIADKYCDGLGACIGDCPKDALKTIKREADEFDEQAVEELLKQQKQKNKKKEPLTCGCPSTLIQTFPVSDDSCACENKAVTQSHENSDLSHWPIQIKLVPVDAPFFKGADLLIASDCVPVAYPSFHRDFLKNKTIMIGCPKFDNAKEYIDKFTEIFKISDIKTITVAVMEVPCCSGMPMIVQKALDNSRKKIPTNEIIVTTRGEILKTEED